MTMFTARGRVAIGLVVAVRRTPFLATDLGVVATLDLSGGLDVCVVYSWNTQTKYINPVLWSLALAVQCETMHGVMPASSACI